jgi:hypothetical protein
MWAYVNYPINYPIVAMGFIFTEATTILAAFKLLGARKRQSNSWSRGIEIAH